MPIPLDVQAHKFIFIGGLHRSGTSLLFKILRDHPDISGFTNTGVPEDEGAHLQTVYTPPKLLGRAGFFALHPQAHQDEHSCLITDENRQKLWDEWRHYWNQESLYLLEKSPGNILLTRFLQAIFPTSYFIIIMRHPIAVSLATRRWFWKFQFRYYRIDLLIKNWAVAHERFRKDAPFLRHILTIRYEELVEQPDKVLAMVYNFLNIAPYSHQHIIHSDTNEKYFHEWHRLKSNIISRPLIRYIKWQYDDRIKQFGYELI